MRRMQEDAVRRVREMQNRARGHLEAPSPRNQKKEPEPELRETTVQETHIAETALSPLETLMHDHERTLVLALLILLGSEKTNTELLFALLYLLL
ncbi:MAG TPA: hypothetical protein IAA80_10895 [Candidatus Gallacutalibacter pullistercoris]|nr:hypothetical protein [Candidatus Gallacutalibacter pullistercoris]